MIRYAIPLDGGHLLSHIPFSQLNNWRSIFGRHFFGIHRVFCSRLFSHRKKGAPRVGTWGLCGTRPVRAPRLQKLRNSC